jgi:hypothetical protein
MTKDLNQPSAQFFPPFVAGFVVRCGAASGFDLITLTARHFFRVLFSLTIASVC